MKKRLFCLMIFLMAGAIFCAGAHFERSSPGDFQNAPAQWVMFADATPENVVRATSRHATDLAVGDLNQDELEDIVVALPGSEGEGRLQVLINRGHFNFDVLDPLEVGLTAPGFHGEISACEIVDLNNDGYPDIIAAVFYPGAIFVFINEMTAPDDTLMFHHHPNSGIAPLYSTWSIDAVSYDGNSSPDLVINSAWSMATILYRHQYNDPQGDPHFQPVIWSGFEVGEWSFQTCAVDLYEDGCESLCIASYSLDSIVADPNPIFWQKNCDQIFTKYEYEGFTDPTMRTFQMLSLDEDENGTPDHLYYLNGPNGYGENSENRMYKIAFPLDPGGGSSPEHPVLRLKDNTGLELRGDDACGRFGDMFKDDFQGEENFHYDFVRARYSLSLEPCSEPDPYTKYGNRGSRGKAPMKIYHQNDAFIWEEQKSTGIEQFVANHIGLEVVDLDRDGDPDVVDANYNYLPCYIIKNRIINRHFYSVIEPPQSSALPCNVTVEVKYLDGTIEERIIAFLDVVSPREIEFSLGPDSEAQWVRVSYPDQVIEVYHVLSGTTLHFYPDGRYSGQEAGHGYGFKGMRSGEERGIR